MDVISLDVDIISRNKGREAVQMAAYCSREKLYSEYTGLWHDGTKKKDLVNHEIQIPDCAPDSYRNSNILWNAVETIEKNKNARLARVVYLGIPREFDVESQIKLVRNYVKENFVDKGMCADISIHAGKNHDNPHAHILLTTRSIGKDGSWLAKQKRNYLLDENGNRIKDPITNRYRLGWSIKINDWDDVKYIEKWRKSWADMCNEQFRQLGIPKEVTHMSYKRQGIDKESTKHLGAKVKALEDRGIKTRRGDENRMIEKRNREKELRRIWDRLEQSREMVRDFDR